MKSKNKNELPTKLCPVCQRPFIWRKKWERDWDKVVYCSKRCASNKNHIIGAIKKAQ